jgi:hypothetical protein
MASAAGIRSPQLQVLNGVGCLVWRSASVRARLWCGLFQLRDLPSSRWTTITEAQGYNPQESRQGSDESNVGSSSCQDGRSFTLFRSFFMIVLSVLTRISGRSVAQNAMLAVIGIVAVGLGLIGLFAWLSRW